MFGFDLEKIIFENRERLINFLRRAIEIKITQKGSFEEGYVHITFDFHFMGERISGGEVNIK